MPMLRERLSRRFDHGVRSDLLILAGVVGIGVGLHDLAPVAVWFWGGSAAICFGWLVGRGRG